MSENKRTRKPSPVCVILSASRLAQLSELLESSGASVAQFGLAPTAEKGLYIIDTMRVFVDDGIVETKIERKTKK